MKPRLIPIYFPNRDAEFDRQLATLKELLASEADFLEPAALGSSLPEAEAAVFPQMLGDAYRQVDGFKDIHLPLLVTTSEFGTVSMWDWEIRSYLKSEGIETIAPYNLEQTRLVCKALGVKRELNKRNSWYSRTTPARASRPASSSASIGGKTSVSSACKKRWA